MLPLVRPIVADIIRAGNEMKEMSRETMTGDHAAKLEDRIAQLKLFLQELEETHELFKDFVGSNRPALDVAKVATGEIWYGQKALEVGLVDELQTSDAFVQGRLADWDVFEVRFVHKKNWQEKLGFAAEGALEKAFLKIWQKGQERNNY